MQREWVSLQRPMKYRRSMLRQQRRKLVQAAEHVPPTAMSSSARGVGVSTINSLSSLSSGVEELLELAGASEGAIVHGAHCWNPFRWYTRM